MSNTTGFTIAPTPQDRPPTPTQSSNAIPLERIARESDMRKELGGFINGQHERTSNTLGKNIAQIIFPEKGPEKPVQGEQFMYYSVIHFITRNGNMYTPSAFEGKIGSFYINPDTDPGVAGNYLISPVEPFVRGLKRGENSRGIKIYLDENCHINPLSKDAQANERFQNTTKFSEEFREKTMAEILVESFDENGIEGDYKVVPENLDQAGKAKFLSQEYTPMFLSSSLVVLRTKRTKEFVILSLGMAEGEKPVWAVKDFPAEGSAEEIDSWYTGLRRYAPLDVAVAPAGDLPQVEVQEPKHEEVTSIILDEPDPLTPQIPEDLPDPEEALEAEKMRASRGRSEAEDADTDRKMTGRRKRKAPPIYSMDDETLAAMRDAVKFRGVPQSERRPRPSRNKPKRGN